MRVSRSSASTAHRRTRARVSASHWRDLVNCSWLHRAAARYAHLRGSTAPIHRFGLNLVGRNSSQLLLDGVTQWPVWPSAGMIRRSGGTRPRNGASHHHRRMWRNSSRTRVTDRSAELARPAKPWGVAQHEIRAGRAHLIQSSIVVMWCSSTRCPAGSWPAVSSHP
jgi:hypothetical protein